MIEFHEAVKNHDVCTLPWGILPCLFFFVGVVGFRAFCVCGGVGFGSWGVVCIPAYVSLGLCLSLTKDFALFITKLETWHG